MAFLTLVILPIGRVYTQDDLCILNGWHRHASGKNALYTEIAQRAYLALDSRDRVLARLKTRQQWAAHAASVRTRLVEAIGPFPERTPLNAKVTHSFEENGIKAELVTFDSRPGFTVTGAFFRPAQSTGRLPAILYLSGHSEKGFRDESYQRVIQNLARKGFAVFAIDPISQGERLQYLDSTREKSLIGGPAVEHSYAGVQFLLTGRTLAMVCIWDAMRALDYLAERSDVDMTRIGTHGRSGGGTISAYLGALDNRVYAVAPENYITNFRRLFQSIGPQDAEQNLPSQLSSSLDHGDLLLVRAPKPTLVVTTTRDMFSIQGARETVRSVRPAFASLGAASQLRMIEDDATHESTRSNRERVYAFFMEHLGITGESKDEDIPPIDIAKLRVSPEARTTPSGTKTVHDLLRLDSRDVLEALAHSRELTVTHRKRVQHAVTDLAGVRPDNSPFETVSAGRFQRSGYTVEKIIIDADRTIPIPALLFTPNPTGHRVNTHTSLLYLHGAGKAADSARGGRIEALVRDGFSVLAPDLPGCGELSGDASGGSNPGGVAFNLLLGAQLTGGSVTSIQAEAILRCLHWLAAQGAPEPAGITALAVGTTGPALLHAAVLEPRIRSVAFLNALISWESLLETRYYRQALGSTIVPRALTQYDLPDLLGLLDSRRLLVLDPVGGDGKPASPELRGRTAQTVGRLRMDAGAEFSLSVSKDAETAETMLRKWLRAGIHSAFLNP